MTSPGVELLLIEDDAADAELIMLSLGEPTVARTRHIADGEEALDFLFSRGAHRGQTHPLKVVLLDIKLPRVSGFDVLRELRAQQLTATLPVVMLTSSRMEQDVLSAYRLGANSFVQKPVDFDAFRRTVRSVAGYWLDLNEPPPVVRSAP